MNHDQILARMGRPRDGFVPVEERPDARFGRFFADGTPRLSPSQVNLLLTCPARWKRAYLLGEPDPAGIDALVGTLLHAAMEVALGELKEGRLVGSSEIQSATMDALRDRLRDPLVLAELRDPPGDVDGLLEGARYAIRTAWDWVVEQGFEPTHIEQRLEARLDCSGQEVGLVMVADAIGTIEGRTVIIDWKFPKRNPKAYGATIYARPSNVLAINLYDTGLRNLGIDADELIIAHFGRGEIRPAIASHDASEGARSQALHVARGAIALVQAETLPENPIAAGALCSHKYCAFWADCPAGGQTPKGPMPIQS